MCSMWIYLVFGVHLSPVFKMTWDKGMGDVQRCADLWCAQVPGWLNSDCVMLADAHITDMINIPTPHRNSYSEPCRSSALCSFQEWSPFILSHMCLQLPKVEVSSPLQLVLLKIISLHTFIWYQWRFNVLRCGFRIKLLSTYPLHPDMSLDLSFVGWAHEKRQTFSASRKSPVLSIICVKPPGAGLWMVQDDSEHQKQIEVGTRRLDKHLGGWNSEEVLVCCGVMLTVVSDFKICFTLPWN